MKIPPGWVEIPLSQAATPRGEKSLPSESPELPFIGMDHVEAHSGKLLGSVESGTMKSAGARFEAGDVLYGRLRPYLNKVAIPRCNGLASAEFIVFRENKLLSSGFLAFRLRARDFVNFATHLNEGDRPRVDFSQIGKFAVRVPPLAEQRRIVAKIEELFSELDASAESLTRARALLKTYRQSLLKAAFEGKLTADWRAACPDKFELPESLLARIRTECGSKSAALDSRALPQLSQGWAWAMVKEVGEVQLGRQRAPQHHRGNHLRPYLRVANVLEDALDLRDVKEMNFTPVEYETFALRDGDVLLNEGQAPELLGRPAIYRGQIPECCFQKTLLRFRPGKMVISEFALLVFRHYMRSGRFQKESRITTNLGHLTQVRFVVMEFPVPPRWEQEEIVKRFRDCEASNLDGEIETALAKISALRQSILKRAFSGRLVAHDSSDEPAAALLARLRADSTDTNVRKTRRKLPA